MKHLQTFKMFESTTGLTPDQILFLDKCARGPWSQDPTTGKINVKGRFVIPDNYSRDFKGLQFGKVDGDFDCSVNSLTSLEGAPTTVRGSFMCSHNSLTSLEGAPKVIKGGFYSDDFYFPPGQWGLPTFLQVLLGGSEKQKQMILPLVDPKSLQGKIDQDPEKMAIALKPLMNHPEFQKLDLKWPTHLQSEVDLLGDLERIGL